MKLQSLIVIVMIATICLAGETKAVRPNPPDENIAEPDTLHCPPNTYDSKCDKRTGSITPPWSPSKNP